MATPLVFYYNPHSRAAIVRWMLEEVGAEYDIRPIEFDKNDQKSGAFTAINPMGKIPVIVVGDTTITEVPAIIAWLADAYPDAGLAPAIGTPERGAYYRWLFFGGSCFEPAMTDVLLNRPMPEQMSSLGWGTFDNVLDTIETTLAKHPYLTGDRFTAADLYIGAELSWAGMFGAPRVKDSQLIQDYVARCTSRPAAAAMTGEG